MKVITPTGEHVDLMTINIGPSHPATHGTLRIFAAHAEDGNPYAGDKPSCQLQLDGSFTMRTYPFGDGVPPGKYKVTLVPALAGRIKKPELGDPAKTTLRIDVPDAGIADHRIELLP